MSCHEVHVPTCCPAHYAPNPLEFVAMLVAGRIAEGMHTGRSECATRKK